MHMKKLLFVLGLILPLCVLAETSPNGKDYDYFENGYYFKHLSSSATSLVDADYIEDFIVPEMADGRQVTTIPNKAFANRIDIESVTLSAGLTLVDYGFEGCEYLKKLIIPEESKVKLQSAFRKSGLEEVSLPPNVTMSYAFTYCEALKKVVIDGISNINYSFNNCTALTDLTLKGNIKKLGGFEGCTSLEAILIPATVKEIEYHAFTGCSKLKNVNFEDPSTLETISNEAFFGTAINTMPKFENLSFLANKCFAYSQLTEFCLSEKLTNSDLNGIFGGCSKLEKLIYPNLDMACRVAPCIDHEFDIYIGDAPLETLSVTSAMDLKNGHFTFVRSLKHVKFENSTIKKTYSSTFSECVNLESVEIGAGAMDFGYCAFRNCGKLRTVTVSEKNKSTTFENAVFENCVSLESISFPEVTALGNDSFSGCASLKSASFPKLKTMGNSVFMECVSLQDVDFPEVETAGYGIFRGCKSLRTVNMPKYTGASDGGKMFYECQSLETVNMPMLSNIDSDFFNGCESLHTVILGENAEIGNRAFYNCKSLKSLDFSKVQKIGSSSFFGCGLEEAVLSPTTMLMNGFPFKDCPNLKKVVVWGSEKDLDVENLPALENLQINGDIPTFEMDKCMTQNAGTLIFNGNVEWIVGIHSCSNLQQLEFKGKIGSMQSNSNWTLFQYTDNVNKIVVSDISNWLNCKFGGEGCSPAWGAPEGSCDFYVGDEKLTHLRVPAGVDVPLCSFAKTSIEEVTIESGDEAEPIKIGDWAFYMCTELRKVNFRGDVSSIGAYAFDKTAIDAVAIPNSVTRMGDGCFERMANLRSITLPEGITEVPSGFVYNCPQLEKLIIPEGVKTLGYAIADEKNSGLKFLSLPSTLEVVSSNYFREPFENLASGVEIWCWAVNPPQGARQVLGGATVHVPSGSGEAYRNSAIWKNANIVDDADVSHEGSVSGTSITFVLPANDISVLGKVEAYIVKLYVRDGEEEAPAGTYEFDADGVVKSMAGRAAQRTALTIEGLEEDTEYSYAINGYTGTNDLIARYVGKISTDKKNGVSPIEANEEVEAIYDLQGRSVQADGNLPTGAYIIKYAGGRTEKRIVR